MEIAGILKNATETKINDLSAVMLLLYFRKSRITFSHSLICSILN